MGFVRKLSFLVLVLCVLISLISLKKENAETKNDFPSSSDCALILEAPSMLRPKFLSKKLEGDENHQSLEYDYYRDSCPQVEQIIRLTLGHLHNVRSNVASALLPLLFHHCFIKGCDASVLLNSTDGVESEKNAPPNETLKGFDLIDIIKSQLEEACPGVVSCAVLSARECFALSGGPYYPLQTGRRDDTQPFSEKATYELPSPQEDLTGTISSFASRGFDERETVSLLGAHSVGSIHRKFFRNQLYNFDGTAQPDPTLDTEFINLLRSKCSGSNTLSSTTGSLVLTLALVLALIVLQHHEFFRLFRRPVSGPDGDEELYESMGRGVSARDAIRFLREGHLHVEDLPAPPLLDFPPPDLDLQALLPNHPAPPLDEFPDIPYVQLIDPDELPEDAILQANEDEGEDDHDPFPGIPWPVVDVARESVALVSLSLSPNDAILHANEDDPFPGIPWPVVDVARESVALHPLQTGRRDGTQPFSEKATYDLPSPQEDLTGTISSFASRGFDERETVSLLDQPDPTLDTAEGKATNIRGPAIPVHLGDEDGDIMCYIDLLKCESLKDVQQEIQVGVDGLNPEDDVHYLSCTNERLNLDDWATLKSSLTKVILVRGREDFSVIGPSPSQD